MNKFFIFISIWILIRGLFYYLGENNSNYLYLLFFDISIFLFYYLFDVFISRLKISNKQFDFIIMFLFILDITISFLQYMKIVIQFKVLNIFNSPYYMSAGDYIKGFFSNSSMNMVGLSFFLIYLIYTNRSKYLIAISIFFLLCTSYMSGIFVILLTYILFNFLNGGIKRSIVTLLYVIMFVFIIYLISPGNFSYVYNAILFGLSKLGKVQSYYQTIEYITHDYMNFIFGAGPGNFSSRLAFIFSGEYVNWLSNSYVYISNLFQNNALSIFEHNFKIFHNSGGTSNEPFSFYNELFGEYGIIGVILFLSFIYKQYKISNMYRKFLLLVFLGQLLLDYLFFYPRVVIIYLLIDIAISKQIYKKEVT